MHFPQNNSRNNSAMLSFIFTDDNNSYKVI